MEEVRMWVVRAGESGRLVQQFKEKSEVAIGWEIDSLENVKDKNVIKGLLEKTYPDINNFQIGSFAGQLYRFGIEFKEDEYVLTYDSEEREYLIGKLGNW